jgi:hypothetical protein
MLQMEIVFCGFASRRDKVFLSSCIGFIASRSVGSYEGTHCQLQHGGRTSLRTSERLQNKCYTDGKRKRFLNNNSRDNLQIHVKRRVSDLLPVRVQLLVSVGIAYVH